MKMSVSKKAEKVIKAGLEELRQGLSLREVTTIGARMILRVAIEEEVGRLWRNSIPGRRGV